jgi:hypothetical protein
MERSQQVLEWMGQGRQQGRIEERRELLLRVLRSRFPGSALDDLEAVVAEQEDPEQLVRWFDAAVASKSLPAFRAAIQR